MNRVQESAFYRWTEVHDHFGAGDQLRRLEHPLTLGSEKRLFADGTIPAAFKVTAQVSPSGVILVIMSAQVR